MRTRTKVILDEWIGRFVVLVLNVLARLFGAVLSIDHSLSKAPRRIVVCKFLGMGSIIQATPLLQTLRKNFPAAEIIFITSSSNRKLLESISVIDKIYDIDDSGAGSVVTSTFSVLKSLWANRADLYIDLETYSFYSSALATLSCSVNRFGFYRVERNIRMGVYTHMMFFNSRAPISQSYLQMARLAGCQTMTESLYQFPVNDTDRMGCRRKLVSVAGQITGKYVIINPNASDLRVERRWPGNSVVELIQMLRRTYPEKIFLLTGSSGEASWVKKIQDTLDAEAREKVYNTAGLFNIFEFFALIEGSELVVSNDTGPMHISFALNKPTVSLFGPASPSQYGQNKNAFGIYKNVYCSPCVHDFLSPPCKGDNQCMKQITVEEVFNLCREIFENPSMPGKIISPGMNYTKNDGVSSLGIIERELN
jgi:ADP-heptose:LPS heptosyltransferase